MTQTFRLARGGRIDRGVVVDFTFDGRRYCGHPGDTLASALLANGVRLVGRSFKYHRPRGVMALGVEEPNALVGVQGLGGRHDPNTRATTLELHQGLSVESQNRWPSLRHDLGAAAGLAAPLIPAGFYYKTFIRPRAAWRALYEPLLRRMAGLGRAPRDPDPDSYASTYGYCDLLVVGGGPAGLSAALAAARQGLKVVLCDEDREPGGALLQNPDADINGRPAWDWVEETRAQLARGGVRVLVRTTAFGRFGEDMVGLCQRLEDPERTGEGVRERLWLMRARAIVLATGAIERPLTFRNNDRPGVMLAGAAAGYVGRYGVAPGRTAVVCVRDDSGYDAAIRLAGAGLQVSLADARPRVSEERLDAARRAGVAVDLGLSPVDVKGELGVKAIGLAPADGAACPIAWRPCDLVAMSGGWTPSIHLHSHSGGRTVWREEAQAFLPESTDPTLRLAGASAGLRDMAAVVADGQAAGEDLAALLLGSPPRDRRPKSPQRQAGPAPGPDPFSAAPAFVDFQNDVTAKDLALASREGFRSIEHIKRYTTAGMATDQGRTSNIVALQLAARLQDKSIPEVGHTTFRQPYTPVTFGALAGRNRGELFEPVRTTPMDSWAESQGAVFENVGAWRRARYFPRAGEDMGAAVTRECGATRQAAGLFDASTLGKIEVVGPDAAEFLDRLYVNSWRKLEPGRCRYGVMLKDDGFVFDDGVVGRIAPDRFHVTTTTTGAAAVLHHMEDYLQTEFPGLRVWLTSTTEAWGVIAINGPRSRDIIAPFVTGLDLDPAAFPHMSVRTGRICGVPCRLFRVSFTGELGFEINVPSSAAPLVWRTLHDSGAPRGLTAYGTEAMHVLRAEKGYIIVGQDTDGTVTPHDLGLGWAIGKKKADFVGQRSLSLPGLQDSRRRRLVGLLSRDRRTVLEEGAQVVSAAAPSTPLGHVTSAYWSAAASGPIALALIEGGLAPEGARLLATALHGPLVPVEVTKPVFYDPTGERLNG